jgi:peptidoglycan-associated lipoprotein
MSYIKFKEKKMKKKLLISAALLAILTGCGATPELDVNAEQNQTTQTQQPQTQNQATEEDLTDTTAIQVTDESNEENNNQQIAAKLSKEVVHFDFDKYNIRPDQMPIVKEVANILKDIKDNYTVRIEGNCDEWGSDEYNYALGLKRAKTVKNALVDLGVDANKLTIISYGESNPVCTEHNRACWAKNRRDNFTLLP